MRVKTESPFALSMGRAAVGAAKYRDNAGFEPASLLSLPPDVAEKYVLLLRYSDKARAAEVRLSSLPDDLRARFRRQAVEDPGRIEEIAGRLVAEDHKRRNPFGDPELDALYRKLAPYGSDAQAEFQQALELLKGQVDPKKVFAQITGRDAAGKGKPARIREPGPVVRTIETAQAREERRRRAAKIAGEIEELRRVFEGRYLPAAAQTPKEDERTRAANCNRPGATAKPATAPQERPASEPAERRPAVVEAFTARDGAAGAAMPAVAAPEISQPQGRALAAARVPTRSPKRGASLAAAFVALAVVSGGGVALMVPPGGTAGEAHRQALAEGQRQIAQAEAALREAAARAAEVEAAALKVAEEKARAEEARKQAAEEKLAAEAVARRAEEEARQARREKEEKAQLEAARQTAGAEGRAVAQEAEQRQPRAEADIRRQAEKAETALNLSEQDRKRVQAALTALGHEVPATGYFGPITRTMIVAWQKSQGLPPTGFLDASQLSALYAQTATAARAPEQKPEQKKVDPQRAEAALDLSEQDRKRVQAALTALGHEVPATGYFGPITRTMIAEWQKTQGLPETGFLDPSQLAALYAQATPVLREAEQKKVETQRAEAALNLSEQDRKRVQAALTALGHEVPATGYFGAITRTTIAAWQKSQGLPETGYLTDAQLAMLFQQAALALARNDQARLEPR